MIDLAIGVALTGYHLWSRYIDRHPPEPVPSFLIELPAEIRLVIYDFLFSDHDSTCLSPAQFLEPLLTCRLIYQEAYPCAFRNATFNLSVPESKPPFWSPQILYLPAHKLRCVRKVHVYWDSSLLELPSLESFFHELEHIPLQLDLLTFTVRNPHSIAPFQFKYASMFPGVRDFGRFIMEELPPIANVKKIIFTSPGVDLKRTFQLLFDPSKPRIELENMNGQGGVPSINVVKKNLGNWDYAVVREGVNVKDWRLEMTHLKAGQKRRTSKTGMKVLQS